MVKKRNTNWLLIITVFLFLLSVGVVIYKLIESSKGNVCEYNGEIISYGQTVLKEGSTTPCICTKDGVLICEEGTNEENIVQSSFRTDNLEFSFSFLNTLVSDKADFTKIKTVDITETDNELKVVIEREGWCNTNLEAPSQIAYYEMNSEGITFSTMSAYDEKVHTQNCLISNTFIISPFEVQKGENYTVSYKNEDGKKIDLEACLYNGILFGGNDIFSGPEAGQLCSCSNGFVECK